MASRKRGGRNRKKTVPRGSPLQLVEQARIFLLDNNGRGALDCLRQAQHKERNHPGLDLLFFFACSMRASELSDNGMASEAAAMQRRASQYRTSVDVSSMAEADYRLYIRVSDHREMFRRYAADLSERAPDHAIERHLADTLIQRQCWTELDALETDHPLRRDAEAVKHAVTAMDAADWSRASQLLIGISRSSPYAPWRLFCRAMVYFGADDDENLRRVIALIPKDFCLPQTLAVWRHLCSGTGPRGSATIQGALNLEVSKRTTAKEALLAAVSNNAPTSAILEQIDQLAKTFDPVFGQQIRVELALLATLAQIRSQPFFEDPVKLLTTALPRGQRELEVLWFMLVTREQFELPPHFPAAELFLSMLSRWFPDAKDQSCARACVLETLAKETQYNHMHMHMFDSRDISAIESILHVPYYGSIDLPVHFIRKSIDEDPGHRASHEFLCDMLRENTRERDQYRDALQRMTEVFPDDAQLLLDLAFVYYSRNAYRQAERTLVAAEKLASHDDRIRDLRSIGSLKSADQSRRAGRLTLAARDLQQADELGRPAIGTVLLAKHVMLDFAATRTEPGAVLAGRLAGLPLEQKIRVLVLVLKDMDFTPPEQRRDVACKLAASRMLQAMMREIAAIGDDVLVELLDDLPDDFRILFPDLHVAKLLEPWWEQILTRLDGDRLFKAFDILIGSGCWDRVHDDAKRRLRMGGEREKDIVLLFYLAIVRYREKTDHGSQRFKDVLERATPSQRQRLRLIARRTARHAPPRLGEALQRFDFDLLDDRPFDFNDLLNDEDLEDFDELDEFEPPTGGSKGRGKQDDDSGMQDLFDDWLPSKEHGDTERPV